MRAGQIFFSYSRIDGKFALKLGEDLRKAGVDIWIDQIDIPPSEPWDEEIEKALNESDCVLVILSHTSVASDNVLNEINYALESKKQVLPILLENNIKKPFNIGRLQHIDFTGSYENAFNLLLQSLSIRKIQPVKKERKFHKALFISILAVLAIIIVAIVKTSLHKPGVPGSSTTKMEKSDKSKTSPPADNFSENLKGEWTTEELTNPFDDHDKYKIYFDFEIMGNAVVGNLKLVSTVKDNDYAVKKGILEGKASDNHVSFYTVEQSVNGNQNISYKNFYLGSVQNQEITFSLESDRPWGFPGQKFVARRSSSTQPTQ